MGIEMSDVARLPEELEQGDLSVCELTVTAARACISSGALTLTQLLDSVLRRIKQVDTTICGYIEVLEVSVRAEPPKMGSPTQGFKLRALRMGLSALNENDLHRMEKLEPIVALRGAGLSVQAQ
jgi:hypothetical protein